LISNFIVLSTNIAAYRGPIAIGASAREGSPLRSKFIAAEKRTDTWKSLVLQRLLHRHRRLVRTKGYPSLAVIPDDEIGLEIIRSGLYEENILQLMFDEVLAPLQHKFNSSSALDVGANIGNHSLYFARRFKTVVAFEPGVIASLLLEANIKINRPGNVLFFRLGLSDASGKAELETREPNNLGTSSVTLGPGSSTSESVELRRGDDVIGALPELPKVALIKLDVEGHELPALKGLEGLLRSQMPVVLFETSGKGGECGSDAILSFLRSVGYSNFYALTRDFRLPNWSHPVVRAGLRAIFKARYVLDQRDELENRFYNLAIATGPGDELF
jgi:FkbM family methyltransferase